MSFVFKHGSQKDDQILRQFQYPEFAFVGRSNVGKSSLINTVVQQGGLARTSKTPGRTQQVNYFLNEKRKVYVVDLPGYGFSSVDKKMKKNWYFLMNGYFNENTMIKCVFVLVDVRRGLMESDQTMIEYLRELDQPYRVVLTKCDKKDHATDLPTGVIETSITDKRGIYELQKIIGIA